MLSKKDLIETNKLFHNGKVINESSLDFAVISVQRSRNWLKAAAILCRAILIDHAFEDGNKRTGAAVIAAIMELNNIPFHPERIDQCVLAISKNNIANLKKIQQVITNVREHIP